MTILNSTEEKTIIHQATQATINTMTTNLIRIGLRPGFRALYVGTRVQQNRLRNMTEKLIKKAIYSNCTPELANEAINGYRRSADSDEASEADFLKTDQPRHHVKRDIHYLRALRVTEKLFQPSRRLRPIAFPDLRYYPWTLNVSAEAPYTASQKTKDLLLQKQREGQIDDPYITFHNLYDEIFHDNRTHIHDIKFMSPKFWDLKTGTPIPYLWTTLHSRSHTVKSDKPDKIRAVFGVPKLLLMAENMFIWNLQKEYLNDNVKSPMLWGFETFRGGWMKLWNRLSVKQRNTVLSADWSGFDHKALHEVIDDVHCIWRRYFDFDKGYEPSQSDKFDYSETETDPTKIQRLWDWMTYSIKHTPILAPSGMLYKWQFNGIASGFQQTQLLDSFVNIVYLLTCLSACGINIEADDFTVFVQGDDSLTTFNERSFETEGKNFLHRLSHEAKIRFNANLSPEKTSYGNSLNDVEVMSYRNRSGIAYRDPAEILAKLLYPERARTLEKTAAASLGMATALMGCSRQAYNACHDIFTFITLELGRHPSSKDYADLAHGRMLPIVSGNPNFPTFEETIAINFSLTQRSKSDKNQLWPTTPVGDINFRFLLS